MKPDRYVRENIYTRGGYIYTRGASINQVFEDHVQQIHGERLRLAEQRARQAEREARQAEREDPLASIREALLEPLGLVREADLPSYDKPPPNCCVRCFRGADLGRGLCLHCTLSDENAAEIRRAAAARTADLLPVADTACTGEVPHYVHLKVVYLAVMLAMLVCADVIAWMHMFHGGY
jgi:hypothetical protein